MSIGGLNRNGTEDDEGLRHLGKQDAHQSVYIYLDSRQQADHGQSTQVI